VFTFKIITHLNLKNTSIIFPAFPLCLVLSLSWMIAHKSSEGLFEQNTCLYILAFGIVWSKYTILLIVRFMDIHVEQKFNKLSLKLTKKRLLI
jgi:hypothetical protein